MRTVFRRGRIAAGRAVEQWISLYYLAFALLLLMIHHSLKKTGGVPIVQGLLSRLTPGQSLLQLQSFHCSESSSVREGSPVPRSCPLVSPPGQRRVNPGGGMLHSDASIGGRLLAGRPGQSSLSSSRLSEINNPHNILYVLLDINALNIHPHNDGPLSNPGPVQAHVTEFLMISASKYGGWICMSREKNFSRVSGPVQVQ